MLKHKLTLIVITKSMFFFLVIVDSVIFGFAQCFESLHNICNLFGVHWTSDYLTDENIKALVHPQQKYAK
jgi:hypothetical protein